MELDPKDEDVWRRAYAGLTAAIASEKVRVVGTRDEVREPVPGFNFAGIEVDYPYAEATIEMILSETLYLRSYPYIDDEHWRKGFDDALISRRGDKWKQLMVERSDVLGRWPFALKEPLGTGAPGRPSKSMHLIIDEFERRVFAGELAPSLREEANELVAWIKTAHRQRERPKRTTIENNIRARYRELKAHSK